MRNRNHIVATAIAAALTLGLGAQRGSAQECGFSLRDYRRPLVAEMNADAVREALGARDYAAVASAARAELGAAKLKRIARDLRKGNTSYDEAFNEGEVRASLAVAVVRSGGALGLSAAAAAKKPAQKAKNLEVALKLLANEDAQKSGDPVIATYLGEAHAALGHAEKARAILEDLAAADLIVSPEGWAALAALRSDAALAQAAHARCAAMAGDVADAVCGAAPGAPASVASRS